MSKSSPSFFGFDEGCENSSSTTIRTAIKFDSMTDCDPQNTKVIVAVEKTITIIINERYRIHILCTPCQLDAFVVGYLISEGLIKSYTEIKKIEYRMTDKIWVETKKPINRISYWREIRTSGCVGIRQQIEDLTKIEAADMKLSPDLIFDAQRQLKEAGKIWGESGGTHMSGLFRTTGELAFFSEDIGRHNTLDKVIGQAAIDGEDFSGLFAVVSGRLSSAIVTKLIRAGIQVAVSRTAPMDQAIEIAHRCCMTLIGFSRKPKFNVYSCPERVIFNNINS